MSDTALPEQLGIPSDKIVKYLLNPDHPVGASKARFFLSFGFSSERVSEFADALFASAMEASVRLPQAAPEGLRRVACIAPISTPSGRSPWIRTVWQVDADGTGRLVTAHPDRARDT